MNTIICPHCHKTIPIDKVLEEELRHSIEEEVKNKSREEVEALQQKAVAAAREKFQTEMKLRDDELADNRKQTKELRDQLTELMKQLREEKTARQNTEILMQKKLLEEEDKIRLKAKEEDAEKHRLDLKEKELQLESMRKTIEELQRKGNVGSQQRQGEALELDLETTLRSAMPTDTFEPIGKGVLGADIRQIVRTQRGNVCGVVLWESKRTKAWSDGWVTKLKEDRLKDKAHAAVIVSETLPEEAKDGMGRKEDVWVCSPKLAVALALLLHKGIEDTARQKFVSDRRQTDAERIYTAVTSHEFVARVESMIDTYTKMLTQITTERNAFEKSWSLREAQIQHLMSGISGIMGQIQEAAGPALPPIKNLELDIP